MAEINPNPYKDGDPLGPTGRITGIFDSLIDLSGVLTALDAVGFRGDDAAVFLGPDAAEKFDSRGRNRQIVGLKIFQNAVCDEQELFDQFESALKHGGAVVAIRTGDDESKKTKVVALLKEGNARKLTYWGTWHYDSLG